MYLTKAPGLLKLITIISGLVLISIGCASHFNSAAIDLFTQPDFQYVCSKSKTCPINSLKMEKFFVAITIICLILSVVSLIIGFYRDISSEGLKFKECQDSGFQCLAGVSIIIAGSLMIRSAVNLDEFVQLGELPFAQTSYNYNIFQALIPNHLLSNDYEENLNIARSELLYADKLAAGVIAILNGFIYFSTAAMVFHPRNESGNAKGTRNYF